MQAAEESEYAEATHAKSFPLRSWTMVGAAVPIPPYEELALIHAVWLRNIPNPQQKAEWYSTMQ
jgi:hypothetical protein